MIKNLDCNILNSALSYYTLLNVDLHKDELVKIFRAKLLHDAWNLAYAGDLSFTIAFNMTLFMKFERNHVVWNPVFTFIDQIGRHIDMSEVHSKFEASKIHRNINITIFKA